jgi:hypothetical protein
VAVFKSETYRFLRLDWPTDEDIDAGTAFPDGYVHLPRGIDSECLTSAPLGHIEGFS